MMRRACLATNYLPLATIFDVKVRLTEAGIQGVTRQADVLDQIWIKRAHDVRRRKPSELQLMSLNYASARFDNLGKLRTPLDSGGRRDF